MKRLFVLLFAVLLPAFALAQSMEILFANVGDGDASIIKLYDKVYVIDTGRKADIQKLFNALEALEVDEIDAVFITHSHSDHIGGLEALFKKYTVKKLYAAKIGEEDKKGRHKVQKTFEKLGADYTLLAYKDKIEIANDAYFEVLGPIIKNENSDNDNSLVLMLNAFNKRALFAGDMQFEQEKNLIDNGVELKCDFLKVGNHGNKDATSPEFARVASPEIAFISTDTLVDKNSANPVVINNLKPAKIYVTENSPIGFMLRVENDKVEVFSLSQKEK